MSPAAEARNAAAELQKLIGVASPADEEKPSAEASLPGSRLKNLDGLANSLWGDAAPKAAADAEDAGDEDDGADDDHDDDTHADAAQDDDEDDADAGAEHAAAEQDTGTADEWHEQHGIDENDLLA